MDPVSHDPNRFTVIHQPALLMYDVDDPGHPVSVGRIVKTKIPNNHYLEYSSIHTPDWIRKNMAIEIFELFTAYPSTLLFKIPGSDNRCVESNISVSVASGVLSWLTPNIPIFSFLKPPM